MKKLLLSTVLCASLLTAAEYDYEVTPMIGGTYAEGNLGLDKQNYANAGIAIGFNQTDSIFDQIELGFLNSLGQVDYEGSPKKDTNIARFFSNLIKEYKLSSDTSLYALIGLGVENFDDEENGNKTGLFGNYGFGIKYKLAERLALKFDVRHLIETDDGGNNLLYNLGLSIPFGERAIQHAPETVQPIVAEEKIEQPIAKEKIVLDDDNDGVANDIDKCPNTMKGAKVDQTGCMLTVDLKINFTFDSAKIDSSYESRIEKFADVMKDNKSLKATIKAYTDSTGPKAYNEKLSLKRAHSTIDALNKLGIDSNRLNAKGYGESNPVATNSTKNGRALNRRVTAEINK